MSSAHSARSITVSDCPEADGINSRLWNHFSSANRAALLACARFRRVPASAILVNVGDPAEYLFVLIKGRARHFLLNEQGRHVTLMWLNPGDIFGGAALLPGPSTYLVSTEILQAGIVATWHRSTVLNFAVQHPRLRDNALTIASDYLALLIAEQMALTCEPAPQRLARALVKDQAIVKFAVNSAQISPADQQALGAGAIGEGPEGLHHRGNRLHGFNGSAAMNTRVSENRAKAVSPFLLQQGGIPIRHIVAPGAMGEYGAKASNETKAGRADNGRAQVKTLVNKGITGS